MLRKTDQAGQAPHPLLHCSPLGSIVDSMHPYIISAYRSFVERRKPVPLQC
jgi:hypothetical protein